MNIVDIVIIIFILMGILIGWKQGFTRSFVNCVGYIVIIVASFLLKDPLGELLMTHLPFFNLFGDIKGVVVLNIALYQLVAFLIVFAILFSLLKFIMVATRLFETLLKFAVIPGLVSSILGGIFGAIKNYVLAFMLLYILTLPTITDNEFITKSKYTKVILEQTPVLSMFAKETVNIASEFADIKNKYTEENKNEFNLDTLDLFLKYHVVAPETVNKLVKDEKINITGIETVLEKYGE